MAVEAEYDAPIYGIGAKATHKIILKVKAYFRLP
jgi:hypothetical protein